MATPGYTPTQAFMEAVSSGNLLRTRIMLKDSMVLDPSGTQFGDMLAYATRMLPGLVVPYDGEPLENDQTKWNKELMNRELSLLVNNFSYDRISHLRKVIQKEMADKTPSREYPKKPSQYQAPPPPYPVRQPNSGYGGILTVTRSSVDEKKKNRDAALAELQKAGETMEQIMKDTAQQGKKLSQLQVAKMKKIAQDILSAAKRYEQNK